MPKLGAAAVFTLPGDPRLRRVLVAYGLSRFTEFAGWLAILLVAYDQGGAAARRDRLVRDAAAGHRAGPAARRVRRPPAPGAGPDPDARGVAVSAAVTGVLLFVDAPLWVVLIGGTATTIAVFSVRPSHFSTLPAARQGARRPRVANGWSSFMDGAAIFVGFVLAGVLTDEFGAWVVLALCALLGVVGTLLTSGLGARPGVGTAHGGRPRGAAGGPRGGRHPAQQRGRPGAAAAHGLHVGDPGLERDPDRDVQRRGPATTGVDGRAAWPAPSAWGSRWAASPWPGWPGAARWRPVVLAGALLLGLAQASVALLGALAPVVDHADARGRRDGDDPRVGPDPAPAHHGRRGARPGAGGPGGGAPHRVDHRGAARARWSSPCSGRSAAFVPVGLLIVAIGLLAGRSIRSLDGSPSTARARSPCWRACRSSPPCRPTSSSASPRALDWVEVAGRHPGRDPGRRGRQLLPGRLRRVLRDGRRRPAGAQPGGRRRLRRDRAAQPGVAHGDGHRHRGRRAAGHQQRGLPRCGHLDPRRGGPGPRDLAGPARARPRIAAEWAGAWARGAVQVS